MGLMRQAKKDTRASTETEDVSTNRKIEQSTQMRSPGVGSNDVEDAAIESPDSSDRDGSPIPSAQARRAGYAYSSINLEGSLNANGPNPPIRGKNIVRHSIKNFVIYFLISSFTVPKENTDDSFEICPIWRYVVVQFCVSVMFLTYYQSTSESALRIIPLHRRHLQQQKQALL